MGYYTYYTLEWNENYVKVDNCDHQKPQGAKFCPECGKSTEKIYISDQITEFLEENKERYYGIEPTGESTDRVKWYEHENNIKILSERFPSVLFTLSGEGEESGDIWKKYFLNGKCQVAKAKITFDECTLA